MFSESFQEIKNTEASKLLKQLNSMVDGSSYELENVKILSRELPFYKNCCLVEVTDHETLQNRKISFIYNKDEENIFILDGKNEVIYKLNKTLPFALTEKTAPIYVKFFLSYVRGRYGSFKLIQSVNDFEWHEEPTPNVKKSLGKMIEPLEIVKIGIDPAYEFSSTVIFKDSLFHTMIDVSKDGMMSFTNQELLVQDIPVTDNNFDG